MTKKKNNLLINISIVLLLSIASVCAFMIFKYLVQNQTEQNDLKTLEKTNKSSGLLRLKNKNSDIWGWIKLSDADLTGTREETSGTITADRLTVDKNETDLTETKGQNTGIIKKQNNNTKQPLLSYPIMYTSEKPQKYLRKNFKGEYSMHGLPFLDGYTKPDTSRNWIIYGHHLQDGSMFSVLLKYQKNEAFAQTHKNISIEYLVKNTIHENNSAGNLLKNNYMYHIEKINARVFAYGEFDNDSELFTMQNVTTKKEYLTLLALINNNCIVLENPVMARKIVTLATCKDALNADNGKFVVFAYKTTSY